MLVHLKAIFNRISSVKLRYRMLLIYIVGGALPIILIGLYLVHGTSRILIEQTEAEEATEIEMARRQAEEMLNTVSTVTKYFYFDDKLEQIAFKNYGSYQEVVEDYRSFTSFLDYGRYYNSTIAWMNLYVKNTTLVANSRFVQVTEEMEREEWYRSAQERNGGGIWRYRPVPAGNYEALAMLRMLKTSKGEDVGVLAVYIRPECFQTLLQKNDCDTFVVLNGETVVAGQEEDVEFGQIKEFIPKQEEIQTQRNVRIDGREYVMTYASIPMVESPDYLQIISLRAYRDILREVRHQTAQSAVFFAASAILSMTIIFLFSQAFGSRVERFREQMQKAASGDFALEEKLGGSDEISELYDYLGTMIWQIQKLLAEIYQEKLHAERLTIQQKDAEFKMLASQINPHFLYNTLETIRMRARKSRQYEIEELVKMLAKIMRSNLQAGNSEVTVESETELVEYYLKIQQYRFGNRIKYHIFVEDDLKKLLVLPLIMQPIVENSIIHGLERKENGGIIDISVRKWEGNMVIAIADDGLGMRPEELMHIREKLNSYQENGKHIGISNVHQRIRLKYGEAYGVTIDSKEGKGTKVEIRLPGVPELGGTGHAQNNDY